MTKKEAVELHGSIDCKNHFTKYKKFTNKDIEQSLIKTLNQVYESVEIIKQGRAYVYQLGAKRKELATREDKRITNGAWSIAYTRNLDIMVVSALEQNEVADSAQTLSKWSLDFGLIEPKLYDLINSRYSESLKEQHLTELRRVNIIGLGQERIVNDFIKYTQYLHSHLANTLERMKKAGIIEYYPVPMGFIGGEEGTVRLHESTVKKILSLQRKLMDKHDVGEWYLNTYLNAQKTKNYLAEWKEELLQITDENGQILGLSYWYKTYAIMLKARKNKIITYLEKYNQDVIQFYRDNEESFISTNLKAFVEERGRYVEEIAKKSEIRFLQPRTMRTTLEDLGGKDLIRLPKVDDYTYNVEYYELYFKNLYSLKISELQKYYEHKFN
ncbi:hypothetical protein [Planococcus maritimus]|uniref:hypothetical protein n=1 Tax=Planococcus maritimus TaxID=192421 RepID=UPI00232B623A|nr:hypothetical protein [Planococcus maritimus]